MSRIFSIIVIVLAWLFSTLNSSGWGIAYDTQTKTNIVIIMWFFFTYLSNPFSINRVQGLFIFTILSFLILPLTTANSWDGFMYLMMFPFVYCVSQLNISQKALELSGYILAFLGMAVLYVYSRTNVLSGWNDNQISMIGLFSYIYYSIALYGNMTGKKMTIGLAISALYAISLITNTESRSAFFLIIIAVLMVYSGNYFKKIIRNNIFIFFALNVPLLISIAAILFPDLTIFRLFDEWSQQRYDKIGFNGRNEIWQEAYRRLVSTNFIGEGKFLLNHHNSAVAVISVFGVIGYFCWYKLLSKSFIFMKRYADDNIVFGCMVSFMLIFWQQSFDLGFVGTSPNMIPYAILGVGLARAKSIRHYYGTNKYNRTRLQHR